MQIFNADDREKKKQDLLQKKQATKALLEEEMSTLKSSKPAPQPKITRADITFLKDKQERNWSTDTEQYTLSEEENNKDPSFNYYIGKDQKTKWKKALPPKYVQTRSENIITHLPGVKGEEKNTKSILDCWNLFIDDNILECIVTNTNIYIRNIQQNYSRERDANLTNLHEIKALLGIIYFLGVMKANKLNTDDAWARDSTGFELCRIAMSENRFRFLLRLHITVLEFKKMAHGYFLFTFKYWGNKFQIIHFANGNASKVKSRRHFLKTLSLDLIEEMVKVRTVSGRMPCEIREKASDIFNLLEPAAPTAPKSKPAVVVQEEQLEENLNRLHLDEEQARSVTEAIQILDSGNTAMDRHPERRLKAAYQAFEDQHLEQLKKENPNLRLSQLKQMLKKEWQKSPENPLNQKFAAYNSKN
ncbi:hypothetical protein LAZ67_19002099 [Cordylochernes scorpioides]|uniref:HMG box domain-containing protein n=1 Tax=Cordylochernes scorpioides TaxID=51811 RepID=A0ABY6LIB6_9ARAC|nr:hypothetical protein LAZ67_19002099 [Cordylochernes scorpioides]